MLRGEHNGTNDGIETRRVTAAGRDGDSQLKSFLAHQRKHFAGQGVPPHGPLGKNERLVRRDVEDTAG
jgi:hypothetical protein